MSDTVEGQWQEEAEPCRSIWVFGYKYRIELVDKLRISGSAGFATMGTQTMAIDADQCEEQRLSTLMHEVLHLGAKHMGLEFPEDIIVRLETLFFSLCADNDIDLEPLRAKVR